MPRSSRDRCVHGHPWTPENTGRSGTGYRLCIECRKDRQSRWKYTTGNEKARASRVRLRDLVLDAYGGACVCCGESWRDFLHVDHVAGGGNAHRQTLKSGHMLRHVRDRGFPADFQLLCANCNHAKGLGKDCPEGHRQAVRDGDLVEVM